MFIGYSIEAITELIALANNPTADCFHAEAEGLVITIQGCRIAFNQGSVGLVEWQGMLCNLQTLGKVLKTDSAPLVFREFGNPSALALPVEEEEETPVAPIKEKPKAYFGILPDVLEGLRPTLNFLVTRELEICDQFIAHALRAYDAGKLDTWMSYVQPRLIDVWKTQDHVSNLTSLSDAAFDAAFADVEDYQIRLVEKVMKLVPGKFKEETTAWMMDVFARGYGKVLMEIWTEVKSKSDDGLLSAPVHFYKSRVNDEIRALELEEQRKKIKMVRNTQDIFDIFNAYKPTNRAAMDFYPEWKPKTQGWFDSQYFKEQCVNQQFIDMGEFLEYVWFKPCEELVYAAKNVSRQTAQTGDIKGMLTDPTTNLPRLKDFFIRTLGLIKMDDQEAVASAFNYLQDIKGMWSGTYAEEPIAAWMAKVMAK